MQKTRWKWLIGSLVALGLAVAGTTCGARLPQNKPIAQNLDEQAEIHFAKARACVPDVVCKITQKDGTVNLVTLIAQDKVFSTHKTEAYLNSAIEPIMVHCRAGAAVYGCGIDSKGAANSVSDIGKYHAKSAAYAVSSLALEAVFIRSTVAALKRVLGAIAARMAGSMAAGTACSIADGPCLVGDLVGVLIVGAGTAWSISDLAQINKTLPQDLTATLNAAIEDCRNSCRKAAVK